MIIADAHDHRDIAMRAPKHLVKLVVLGNTRVILMDPLHLGGEVRIGGLRS